MGEYKGRLTIEFIDSADPIAEFYLDNEAVARFRHCDDRIEVSSNTPLILSIKGQVIARVEVSDDEPLVISDT